MSLIFKRFGKIIRAPWSKETIIMKAVSACDFESTAPFNITMEYKHNPKTPYFVSFNRTELYHFQDIRNPTNWTMTLPDATSEDSDDIDYIINFGGAQKFMAFDEETKTLYLKRLVNKWDRYTYLISVQLKSKAPGGLYNAPVFIDFKVDYSVPPNFVSKKAVESNVVPLSENKIRPRFTPDGLLLLNFTEPVLWNMNEIKYRNPVNEEKNKETVDSFFEDKPDSICKQMITEEDGYDNEVWKGQWQDSTDVIALRYINIAKYDNITIETSEDGNSTELVGGEIDLIDQPQFCWRFEVWPERESKQLRLEVNFRQDQMLISREEKLDKIGIFINFKKLANLGYMIE